MEKTGEVQVDSFIRALPKAELHLHLEGTIEPETVVELARNHGRDLDIEEVRKLYCYTDFNRFILCFRTITEHLVTPDDYELITYRLMQRLAQQNVRHAEVYISVGTCIWWGRDFDEVFEGVERGRQRGEREFGVSVLWIFDAVRHFGPEAAMRVTERAIALRERGSVVAIGIGGDERRAGPELFTDVYAYAAANGLRLTCHAGETTGPGSVWGALNLLGTERIGHGLNSYNDPELVRHLRETQVPIEISITSNVRTGSIQRLDQHPVRRYFDQGLFITLNTDDPGIFETDLCREYQLARDVFGFTNDELVQLAKNSFQASFLPESRKLEYLRLFDAVPMDRTNR